MASCFKGNPSGFSLLGLREVIPDQTGAEQWKELTLNTGGAHLTLEDVKLPEGCTSGGFCYRDSLSPLTRNRFITWKVVSDVLELVEHSLDLDLSGNHLRVRFQGLAILEGTSIHETKSNVVILVSTISAVHRLVLPHPSRHSELGSSPTVPSIFTETSQAWLRDSLSHQVVSSSTTNISLPCIAASCVTPGNLGAVFAVANQSTISCIRLGSSVSSHTLQPSSNLTRLLSGYLPNVLRSSSTSENEDTTASLSLLPTKTDDILVAALSKGLKLRIWSSTTQECKLDCDLTEYFGDKSVKQLGSQHRMRYVRDSETGNFCIAVFSSFGKNRSFLLLNLQVSNFKINFVSSVTALHSRLIDFSLTSDHIYALWSTTKGDFLLEFMEIPCKKQEWQSVTLEPGIGAEVEYDESTTDPKEAYLEAIFKSGSFSISTLTRALQAFNRSGRKTSAATIREDIIAAIESELMDQSEEDLSEEEWLQLSCKCWAQFYAYLVQYHSKRRIPLGLLVDESTGLHAVLKMGMFSLLRPLDVVESLVLQKGRRWDEAPFNQMLQHPQSGIVALLEVLNKVNDALSVDQVKRFQQSMFQLESADQIAAGLADELIQSEPRLNLLNCMQMALSSVDVCTALTALLQQLNVNGSSRIDPVVELDKEGKNSFRLLFNGSLGLGALAESARQMADLRLALCRNVLIVQQLLILARKKLQLSPEDAETIRSEFLPRTVPLTHACYALSWLCNHPAQIISNSLMEQNIRTMALLGFKKPQESFQNHLRKSLVELYLSLDGGNAVRNIIMQEENPADWSSPWLDVFPNFMKAVGQLLWPIGNHTSLMEFLMERFQPSAIQGYIRLQQNWCEWNTCSRKFLMAVALVATGEGVKASRWMLEAAEGIAKEDLLHSIVTRETEGGDGGGGGGHPAAEADLAMRYHLICVQLLEQAALPGAALKVALAALNSGRIQDPLIPTMWSIVAKLHLLLGHYQEAYEAIVSNPDGSQRPEILGRLVNTLLERKRMDTLLTFPYAGLESELEKIVERRARSSDVLSMKVYYSFLYAFHVRQGKMRKAAAVMHEQALRYGCEGESALRVKCLLACLNSLRLVAREEAWLVKPVEGSGSKGSTQQRRTVDVIEYDDIEKEYELSYACLNLGQSVASLTPADVVALLTCRNRYESALRIARIFNVKETALIVEHLAANCVALSRDHGDEEEAWIWLAENRCSGVGKASEQAWRLLEKLLPKAEGSGDNKLTRCHKAASRKILSLDCTLPYWLTASYKLRNPGELISVFHQAGLLEDAAQVALEMFDAVLGKGKEYFGFSNPSEVNAPPIWLPYNVLDRLLLELNAHSEDPIYRKLLDDLKEKMDEYFKIAERISRSVIESSMS